MATFKFDIMLKDQKNSYTNLLFTPFTQCTIKDEASWKIVYLQNTARTITYKIFVCHKADHSDYKFILVTPL